MASGIAHRSTKSKVVKTRAHLMAARLKIPEHEISLLNSLRERGIVGQSWETTGRINGLALKPSVAFSKASASS